MKIFLIGFMGCGKSKLGKSLASKTEQTFLDLDDLVEAKCKLTIPEIFAAFGESEFRQIEKEVLQSLNLVTDAIVATGGGAPCFFENMAWMNQNGLTIFIDTPTKVLADRLINARVERPLVKGKSLNELIDFIDLKLKERRPFYEQSQIIIKGVDLNVDMLLATIEKHLD